MAEQVSLEKATTVVSKEITLLLRFHSLGYYP